jgi:hypothetical protein
MGAIRILVLFLRGVLRNRTELAADNLALRQQLATLQQKSETPRLRRRDRAQRRGKPYASWFPSVRSE